MEPFKINVEESVLIDLKQRLANTRWPGEITDSSWQYGTNLAYVKELCDYWLNEFDWRAQEQRINSFSNFVAPVSGLNVHFIYEKGKGPNSIPLIITHGWPSTFAEMVDIIPMLTDPASHGGNESDSFDVIVPSMPGYCFSEKPSSPGVNPRVIAQMWVDLMLSLIHI